MVEHRSAWAMARMETISIVNMVVGAVVLSTAFAFDLPAWTFWSAIVVGTVILVLEAFDEWAERRDMSEEVVGPEAIVLVAALWLAGTVLVAGGPTAFVAIGFLGGLLVTVTSAMNLISSAKQDSSMPRRKGER